MLANMCVGHCDVMLCCGNCTVVCGMSKVLQNKNTAKCVPDGHRCHMHFGHAKVHAQATFAMACFYSTWRCRCQCQCQYQCQCQCQCQCQYQCRPVLLKSTSANAPVGGECMSPVSSLQRPRSSHQPWQPVMANWPSGHRNNKNVGFLQSSEYYPPPEWCRQSRHS